MALTVRSVNPEDERQELLAVLRRNLTDLDHARRFRWLYLDNPAGPARAWFLREREGSGAPVGAASLFPRWVWLRGQVHLCGQVGDFAVDAGYRSLGPAVMLQRATFGPVDGRALAFCYDCPPHDKGMATFRRLGLGPQCRMLRHARLIKVDRIVRRRVRPAAAVALSWLGNGVLRLVDLRRRLGPSVEIAELGGRFDDEFSALDAKVGGRDTIRGRRRAEDLNWRYRDDPLHQYLVLTARRAGALVAFAVVLSDGADAFLVDLFGRLTPEVASQLVDGAVDRLRRTDIETLQALTSNQGDLVHVLRAAGFRYRSPGASVVAYAPDGGDVRAALDTDRWSLTDGDIRA